MTSSRTAGPVLRPSHRKAVHAALRELTVSGRLLFVTADTDAAAVTMARETVEDAYRDVTDAEALDGAVILVPSDGGPRLVDETLRDALAGSHNP